MIILQDFQPWVDINRINRLMESTSRDAVINPKALYWFMQRFARYSRTYGFLVPTLASTIGSSLLFNDPACCIAEHAERSMDVAAKVFTASIEEFRDPRTGVSHRTLSYALLDKLAEYADLSAEEIAQMAASGTWLDEILPQVEAGYHADPTDLSSLVEAMGFHAATETVGGNEFSIINTVLFSEHRNNSFGQFIKRNKISFEQGIVSPWYWVVIHGTENTIGVEADHSHDALTALNLAAQYTSASQAQIIAWAGVGFAKQAHIQETFFHHLQNELRTFFGTSATTKTYAAIV